MKPFIVEDLVEINPNCKVSVQDDYVIIDDYYKNYDEICSMLKYYPAENWKMSDNTRNFKDYYDCRVIFQNIYPEQSKLQRRNDFFDSILNLIGKSLKEYSFNINFNCFKPIKQYSINEQHFPHVDPSYNLITFVDKVNSGGLALYKDINWEDTEHYNTIVNISELEIEQIIASKPNRAILIDGKRTHGAYISDYSKYKNNWRITSAQFLEVK